MKPKIITVKEHLKQQRVEEPLTKVIYALSEGVKEFGIWLEETGDCSYTGESCEARGDKQLVADAVAEQCFKQKLFSNCPGLIAAIISEESGFEEINREARYLIVLDPDDGSKNVLINGPFGSIVLIVEKVGIPEQFKIKASVVATYGVRTDLYVALAGRVDGYTLDKARGKFVLTEPGISIPKSGKILVPGKLKAKWPSSMQECIAALERDKERVRNFGAFVCDCINLLFNGGIFFYPDGKLLLLCELMALAFLIEQAGGSAIDVSGQRIVELLPQRWEDWKKNWNAKSGIAIGSLEDVEKVLAFLKQEAVSLRKAA
jgi:fructose-1,6-bisphosphatase I